MPATFPPSWSPTAHRCQEDSVTLSAKPASDPAAGASLYGESFCASCHAVQNAAGNMVGGNVGPELTKVGSKVKPEWLQAWLQNPRNYDPGTAMPHYRLNDGQVATLSTFLLAKIRFRSARELSGSGNARADCSRQAPGFRLRLRLVSRNCRDQEAGELCAGAQPHRQQVDYSTHFLPGMPHTLPDYIAGKIKQPRAFSPGLRMPQYSFTPAQIDSLTTALLALNEHSTTLPASLAVPAVAESNYQPAGKAGKLMSDLACFSCHRINGHGGDMAPDLTWEGSSVQREWLVQFFKNPGTLRPALIRRMPRFNLTDGEANELTDYIMTVYQNPAVDRDSMPLSGYSQGEIELGKQLFYGKYSCQGCHIVDTKTDKGYIGPTLTHVGSRLTAAWIYQWMKNPQALRPGTIEPNRAMSDEDARALTAFLISQKGRSHKGDRKEMNRRSSANFMLWTAVLASTLSVSCSRKSSSVQLPKPTAFGAAIVESSGGKQVAQTGALLPQPLVVQVNDEQGNAVAGALVEFQAAPGVVLDPANGLTDSSGQLTTQCVAGRNGRPLPDHGIDHRQIAEDGLNSRLKKSHWAISRRSGAISTHNIAIAATIRSRPSSVFRTTTIWK